MKRRTVWIVLTLLITFNATATDYYVATTGNNTTGNGSSTNPWKTITYALSKVSGSGHIIHVAAGTYDTALGETFPIVVENGVSLSGEGAAITIIDAGGTAAVFSCIGITDASTFIEGLTITGGDDGAITMSAGSAPTIRGNIFSDNEGYYSGSVFYISNSSPQIKGNRIINNSIEWYSYGCIYIDGSSSAPRLINNLVAKNECKAIYCENYCTPTIINNTISDNLGDGIYLHYSHPNPDSIVNNIISYNSGYGIYEDYSTSDPGVVSFNLFFSNSNGLYFNESSTGYYSVSLMDAGVAECKNNSEGDPLFIDRNSNDYHEQSYSPAIDSGDPVFPYANEPEDNGDRINIGAYGNTGEAAIYVALPFLPVDLYVDAITGSNTIGDGTSGSPWQTITYALSQIYTSGHIVHVAEGTYNAALGETFPITMENGVSLSGAGASTTIIYSEETARVIICTGISDASTFIEGFTITGLERGAMTILSGSDLTIRNNVFSGNEYSYGYGSVFYIDNSSPQILGNRIINNSMAYYSPYSTIYISGPTSAVRLVNNLIANNSGDAIDCRNYCTPTIINNTISDNSGNGIFLYYSYPHPDSIVNNIISFNSDYGIYEDYTNCNPGIVSYNLFCSNGSGLYYDNNSTYYFTASSMDDGIPECENNLDGDPAYNDRSGGDYHLQEGSPAIDAGDPGSPLDPDGSRADIGAFCFIMPPPDPPVANAPSFIGQTDMILSWNSSPTASGYMTDLATDAGFTSYVSGFQNLDVMNVNTYSVTGLTGNTTYYFRMRAYNEGGTSANSNVISAVTMASLPPAPEVPVVYAGADIVRTSFTADWETTINATSYRIDVATDATFGSYVSGYNNREVLNATEIRVTGLTANSTYVYRVRACNSGGCSANSDNITVITLPDPPAAPVAGNPGELTQTSFTANWNSSENADGYYLDVATDETFNALLPGFSYLDVSNVTSYNVAGLTANVSYYYRIAAYNEGGASGYSETISATTLPYPPPAPVCNEATDITNSSFTANWNSSFSATGYEIEYSINNIFTTPVWGIDANNVTSYNITGLSSNTTYYYHVRGYNTGGTGDYSDIRTITTFPDPPPAPVALEASDTTQTSFTANWESAATATGYLIEVATDIDFTEFVGEYYGMDVHNVLSYSVTGLSPYTTYYYRITSYNEGGSGGYSNAITVITLQIPPPAAPVANEALFVGQTDFTASWNSSETATGYMLDVCTTNDFTTCNPYNLDVGDVTSYSITGLTANTTYYYRVRAYNAGGTGDNSNTITVTTLLNPPDPPPAPTAFSATNIIQTSFDANWSEVVEASGYKLDVSTDNTFTSTILGNIDITNSTSYVVDDNITASTTYYYRLRAYNSGGTSSVSNTITVTTLPEPPPIPLPFTATSVTTNGFTANWDDMERTDGYKLSIATDDVLTQWVAGYQNLDVFHVTSYVVTGLGPNTTYYYCVRGYNEGGESDNSGGIEVTTLLVMPDLPAAPTANQATNITQTQFQANWTPSASAIDGFYLDVGYDDNFSSYVTGYENLDVGYDISLDITGLSSNTIYYYRVKGYNVSGSGDYSNVVSVTTLPDPPPAPSGFTASSCNNDIYLGWGASTDPLFQQYNLYWGTSASSTTLYISITDPSTSSYVIDHLVNGQTYYFRITTVLSPGVESSSSSDVSVVVKTGVVPQIKAKWGDVLICYNQASLITSFRWYLGSSLISNATKQYYVTNKQPGLYHVETTDTDGCINSSNTIEIGWSKSLSVYPNPAKISFTLNLSSEALGEIVVNLYNSAGMKALEYRTGKNETELSCEIPLGKLKDGIYMIEVIVNDEDIYYTRLIIIE